METSSPVIGKSYKSLFPFRLGTTSYIYPAPILPNVMRLGPFFDEIELVLYESSEKEHLPEEQLIDRLKALSIEMDVGFNVHLPLDVYLGDARRTVRSEGVRIVKRFIERTIPLTPSTYTLHFSLEGEKGRETTDRDLWKRCVIKSIEEILTTGIAPSRLSIETLGYPYEWIEDMVKALGLSICLDLGHLLIRGVDLRGYLERYLAKTSIIHLHGVENGRDHLGIDRLSGETLGLILSYLRHYQESLSIEVFSFDDLKNSLETLEGKWPER
jgi:sugar phosphate isomerase/epimerase